jgi:hypothetical protein
MIKLRNCEFAFKCTANWHALESTSEPDVKFCHDCNKEVYLVTKPKALMKAIQLNRCVAIESPPSKDDYEVTHMLGEVVSFYDDTDDQ